MHSGLGKTVLLHLLGNVRQIAHAAARNSQPRRVIAHDHPLRSAMARQRTAVHDHRLPRRSRWTRRHKLPRRIYHARKWLPSRPVSGLPHPSICRQEQPRTVAVRHPTPWIARDPRVAESRIPHPGAIHERVPSQTSEIRLPAHSIAWRINIVAVIGEIAHPV